MSRRAARLLAAMGTIMRSFSGRSPADAERVNARLQAAEAAAQARLVDPPATRSDLTRAKAGKRELSRRKEDFLKLLSHELRNPLSAIQSALAVMRARRDVESGQRAREVVERQIAHIARLVEDLVDTARIERGTLSLHFESVDLRDVLRTAVEMAQPSITHRRQTLTWAPSAEPLPVNGDPVRLQQVFSNLLLNASKYTPEGGAIDLASYRRESDFCVAVRDTGIGIPAEMLERIFEPFARATEDVPGLGVGLYVARTLVAQHGGVISVESGGAGRGSTFTVRLPELSPLLRQMS